MARISTYDNDTTVSASDRVIGSDADNGDLTQNYTMGDILTYIQNNITVSRPFGDNPATATTEVATGGQTAFFTSTMPADSIGAGDILKFRLVATTEVGLDAAEINLSLGVLVGSTEVAPLPTTTAGLTIVVDGQVMVKALDDVEVSYVITASGVSYNESVAGRVQSSFTQNLSVQRSLTAGWSVNAGQSNDLTVQAFSINAVEKTTTELPT